LVKKQAKKDGVLSGMILTNQRQVKVGILGQGSVYESVGVVGLLGLLDLGFLGVLWKSLDDDGLFDVSNKDNAVLLKGDLALLTLGTHRADNKHTKDEQHAEENTEPAAQHETNCTAFPWSQGGKGVAQTDHEWGTVVLRARMVAVVCRHSDGDKALVHHRTISVHGTFYHEIGSMEAIDRGQAENNAELVP